MRPWSVCVLKRLALVVLAAASATAGTVADIVEQISQEKYSDHLRNRLFSRLGNSRDALVYGADGLPVLGPDDMPVKGADHDAARDYIAGQFRSYGLETYQDVFTMVRTRPPLGKFTGTNVVATLRGTKYPDRMYILGAHYDSRGPGADDDASGVAGLLEAARVLASQRFEYTILFIAFDFEEVSCSGAGDYVWRHQCDQILGMVELDMIAYNDAGRNRAEIWTGPTDPNPVSIALAAAMSRHAGDLKIRSGGGEWASDHGPFATAGFPSALLAEAGPYSPYMHRPFDSAVDVTSSDLMMPDGRPYLDYGYATRMVRGAVGWLAEAAVLLQ